MMRWNRAKQVLLAFFSCCLLFPAHGNLIINGSFEQNNVGANSWRWFNADDVSGWSGSNIEIWDRFQGFQAFEGFHHAELNAHGQRGQAFSIFQQFDTQIGSIYSVNFAYAARRSNHEAFAFDLYANDFSPLISSIIDDHTVRQWSRFESTFVATSTSTTIRFSTLQPFSGTVGNFIDDVNVFALSASANKSSINSTSDISEPSLFAFVLLGVVFLGLRQKFSLPVNE